MINEQTHKYVKVIQPATLAKNVAATVLELDTSANGVGFDYITFIVSLGLVNDSGLSILKVQESDVTGSGQVDIPATVYGGANNPALPAAAATSTAYAIHINMINARKRFLTLSVAAANVGVNGVTIDAVAVLSRADQLPSTLALRGFTNEAFV